MEPQYSVSSPTSRIGKNSFLKSYCFSKVYENGKMTKRIHDTSTIAMIGKREVVLLLERTGLKIERVYGDYNKSDCKLEQAVFEARKV